MTKLIHLRTEIRPRKPDKPGTIPAHQIPVYDHLGNMRGRVGAKATSATVSRFGVGHGATLQTVKGRTAWVGRTPGRPQVSVVPLLKSLKAAKGSNR